jgi:hypothetical protein
MYISRITTDNLQPIGSAPEVKEAVVSNNEPEGVTVETNPSSENEDKNMTARALLCLDVDLKMLNENVERIRVQIHALQKRHGIDPQS